MNIRYKKSLSIPITSLNYNRERKLKIPYSQKRTMTPCSGGGVNFLAPLVEKGTKETQYN